MKHFSNNGDFEGLLEQARTYLNGFVAPHNLVSLSAFEDDHPCPTKLYHVIVLHKGNTP